MTPTTARRRTFGAVVSVAALLVLSACGGVAEGSDVASAGGEASPDPVDTEQEASEDEQSQVLAFVDCMRENGLDMPDPGPGQEGLMSALQEARGDHDQTTVNEDYDEAFAACEDLLPEFATHDDGGPDEEAMLELAECLRDEGLDVPDDLFSGNFMHDVDRDELNAAMGECRDEVDAARGGNE